MAERKNDRVTPGPADSAAIVPGRMKIPVPITAPMPIAIKSLAVIVLTNFLSAPK